MKEYIIKVDDSKPDVMGSVPLMDKPKELVRCVDCKHFNDMKCSYPERGTCDLWHMLHWGEWFCADGERLEKR